MQNCGNKIDRLTIDWICISDEKKKSANGMPPLKLMNTNFIQMNDLYFRIIWSFKCRTLILESISMTESWCEYIINSCDCSGIESLTLDEISIGYSLSHEMKDEPRKMLLSSLAQKFKNVRELKMVFPCCWVDEYIEMDYFLKCLCSIVRKNAGRFELDLTRPISPKGMVRRMVETNVKIDVLTMRLHCDDDDDRSLSIEESMYDVKLLRIDQNDEDLSNITKIDLYGKNGNMELFPSIEVLEIISDEYKSFLDDINKFLGSNIITKWSSNGLFLRCIWYVSFKGNQHDIDLFAVLCGILYSLLTEKMIPMDISVELDRIKSPQVINRTKNAYLSHLNKENISKKYQQPILNEKHRKFCQALSNPIVTFSATSDDNERYTYTLRVANARVI